MSPQSTLRIALAQVNATVGDIDGNAALIVESIEAARDAGAALVALPELAVTGYPPEDLLLKPHFLAASARAVAEIAAAATGIVALDGHPEATPEAHNSLAVLADGEVKGSYRKNLLPNYGVFDERRYFHPGAEPALVELNGARIGLTVCEDIWFPGPPASIEAMAGASLIVNSSASPYHAGKGFERERMVARRAAETRAAYALCNTVGGQDELVFDGHSIVVGADGETLARAAQFEEELLVCELEVHATTAPGSGEEGPGLDMLPAGSSPPVLATVELPAPAAEAAPRRLAEPLQPDAEVYAALRLGLADYARKNGFEHAVLALSGGIDSALVALLAVDALGPERVSCVIMPSPHSSSGTQQDARRIASNLGVETIEIPIADPMRAYDAALAASFAGTEPDTTEENLQARIRGNLVMALSNKFGWLPLTTGNKSELSVGYATLYGDMAGGFAVIKDVPKTLVYRLVRHRNALAEASAPIPESVIERPPSAELRPDQLDEDSLPPYEILDRILAAYVEEDRGRDEIVAEGLPEPTVDEVIRMVDRAEYKRRQAPPGVKISPKAFGRDRRLPITNRFRG